MTPQEIKLVQASFSKVAPISAIAADLFYTRLFQIAPDVRRFFPDDLAEQKKKLTAMLATVVGGLAHLDILMPAVQALGRRHAGYGVAGAQFASFGAALLWTLDQVLGNDFTPEVRDAWANVYDALAQAMIDEMGRRPA